MITVEALSRNYGDFQAVKQVTFSIKPGEIVGLLGHNGAGKTTIMKMLTGFLEPSAGRIRINDLDLREHSAQLRRDMGYLPENPPTYPEMSVCDYLDYAAQLRGVPAHERIAAVRDAIAQTELADKVLQPISTLSRGYRQRVGVAQAIVHKPKILILDEPTNGLDPSQIQHMRELIRGLREKTTVILSTHIMQEVNAVCDRVLMIRHGELALDSTLAELQQSNRIRLRTDLQPGALQTVLGALPTLQQIQHQGIEGDHQSYVVATKPGSDIHGACAEIAQAVIQASGKLFALNPEVRDLERLFREINQTAPEVAHAA